MVKYTTVKHDILKDGHTMFAVDVVKELNHKVLFEAEVRKLQYVIMAIANTAQLNPDRSMVEICNDNFIVSNVNVRAEMIGSEDQPIRFSISM